MLFGEIPSATSVNPQTGQSIITSPLSQLETISMEDKDIRSSPSSKFNNLNLYNSLQAAKNGENIALYGSLTFPNNSVDRKLKGNEKLQNANGANAVEDESDLPDDISLTLAFEDMNIKRVVTKETMPASDKYDQTFLDCSFLNNSLFRYDTDEIATLSLPTTANGVSRSGPGLEEGTFLTRTNEFMNSTDKVAGQGIVKFLELNNDEMRKQNPGSLLNNLGEKQQSFPMYSGALHVNPGMLPYQLLPTAPVPGLELTASPYQHQYFLDSQSPAYIHPQDLCWSSMTWQKMEEESYYKLHQQCLYPQLHGHSFELLLQKTNSDVSPLTGSTIQPIQHQLEQGSLSSYWSDNAVHRGHHQLDLSLTNDGLCQYHPQSSCRNGESFEFPHSQKITAGEVTRSTRDFQGHQILNKVGNQYCPEKILTRSHGVNSLKSLRSSAITTSQSLLFSDINGVVLPNCHSHHPLLMSNGSFKLGDQNSRGSSPDNSDLGRSSKSIQVKYNSVDEVMGKIYSMAKDQHGCRFLQRKFTEGSPEDVNKIFAEIISHIVELMTDPFGNYLVQKLLEVCNGEQRMCILQALTKEAGELIKISCDMHGTRAVQKVIETLQTTEQISMVVSALKPGIVSLIKDINGNHVAQRCLQYFSPEYTKFLFDAAIGHCVELATDRQGCCVLQKCIYHADGDQRQRLMSEISSYSLALSQDPYGNYVVQYALDQKVPWVTAAILDQLDGNYEHLSVQKYSSNVVEKCLKLAKEPTRCKIIQELITAPRFLQILQDPYGNYVIQSALSQCKGALHASFVEAIRPHVQALRSSPYGKKVLSSCGLKK